MRIRLILLAMLAALCLPGVALAHAALESSDPAPGVLLADAPASIRLTFNEAVTPLVFRWIGPDGNIRDLDAGALSSANGVVTVIPPADLTRGSQVLSWRVASSDGHPVGGTLGFVIGVATGGAEPAAPATGLAAAAARWSLTMALVLGVGAAVYISLVAAGSETVATRRIGLWSATATVPLAWLAAGLHGADMLGIRPGSLLGTDPWAAVAPTGMAGTAGLSILAALLALAVIECRGRTRKTLALMAWGLAALSFVVSGHATTPVRIVALTSHAATFTFWIGSLPGLLLVLRAKGTAALPALRRFSALAVPLVILLLLSGVALTIAEAGGIEAVATSWGLLLAAKLMVVALMLGLAALNRQRLTPRLAAGGSSGPLRRSIAAELALAILVLALASGFRLTGTPMSVVTSPGVTVHVHGPTAMANLSLSSARRGLNRLRAEVSDADFGPLEPREVQVALDLPAAGIEKLRLKLQPVSPGLWQSEPFNLPLEGRWTLTLRILIDDFTSVALSTEVEIVP